MHSTVGIVEAVLREWSYPFFTTSWHSNCHIVVIAVAARFLAINRNCDITCAIIFYNKESIAIVWKLVAQTVRSCEGRS
ncbi:hypothetical protein [Atrimonas thermophila]|uniref:hypothetical protein n=1 Tax=Atrimonas thermophila TaxID=3064161 RepID=UPI00399D570E